MIATDQADTVERFVGSDEGDVLFGRKSTYLEEYAINGGCGDDLLYTRGATHVLSCNGDDRVVVTRKSTVVVFGSFDGGDNGFDTLDLRAFGAARWSIDLNGASQNLAKAFDPDQTGVLSRGGSRVFTANIHDFEEILLGDGDNASIGRVFRFGDGADRFEQVAGDGVFYAGGGDDRLIVGDRGRANSENGDDHISFDGQLNGHFASGGRGTDYIMAARMRGEAHGDAGRNTLAFGPCLTAATADVQVNLRDGTALSVGSTAGSANVRIDLAIWGFEVLIGSHLGDDIVGAGRDEQIVGRAGSDTLSGLNGDGNDTLDGSNGDDLLHGGLATTSCGAAAAKIRRITVLPPPTHWTAPCWRRISALSRWICPV